MATKQKTEQHRRIIDGRWGVIGSEIAGGMASVVPAFDLEGDHGRVALKLLAATTDDPWRRKSFEREQEALERLTHPNIVKLLARGRDAGTGEAYLVFPWLEVRLQDRLREHGAMAWERWWEEYGEPILSALELAHRQQVYHRDLKPANVLLDADGIPHIIDFGIAKLEGLIAPERTVAGESPPFTPPEQTATRHTATRDVYAWAALTAFAVSGHDPYPAAESDPPGVLARALAAAAERLPASLGGVLARCVDHDPALRPATGGVLLADVRAALAADGQARAARQAEAAPVVHLRLSRSAREGLELDLDLFSAVVDERVAADLAADHAVLPYPGEPDHYIVVGRELSLHVCAESPGEQLTVLNALAPRDSDLERDRGRGWSGPLRFSTGVPADRAAAADAVAHLRREVAAHEATRKREQQRARRARPLAIWRALLSLLRSLETDREDPLAYHDVRRSRAGVVFSLSAPVPHNIVGERRLAPAEGGRSFVGDVVARQSNEVTLRAVADSDRDVLTRGQLRLDTRAALTAIDRQQRSLDAVEYGRALRTDLATLLSEPAVARRPVPILGLRFGQSLDEPKRHAVEAALGSDDLLVVQGPPGTGKTTFITELVVQELARNPDARILISSQAHAALDNALTELHQRDETIRLLRLARSDDERVSADVAELLLDEHLSRWRADAIKSGNAWLGRWAKDAGVSERDVEAAMRLRELAALLQRHDELTHQLSEIEAQLDELREAARGAAPAATASVALRERTAELEELRESDASAQASARDLVARLGELGELPKRTRTRTLVAAELAERGRALLPDDAEAARRCERLIELLAEWHARFGFGPAFRAAALLRSQVVAATCVGLGGVRGAESVEFDLCIVDEASKATAPELLIPLALARRIVLVGDDKQLPPYIDDALTHPDLLAERGLDRDEIKSSLFTQLARGLPTDNVVALTHQHRMHPAIGRLISECFYDRTLTSEPRQAMTLLQMLAPRPVTWLTTAGRQDRFERQHGLSFANDLEARVIKTFLETANGLAAAGRRTLDITVLAGYGAQRDTVEKRLGPHLKGWRNLQVECHTVDSYQGRQADIVLYSMTRSNPKGEIGFLRERPRLNVALSRARDLLVIVGDHAFARDARGGQALRRVLDHIEATPDDSALEPARIA